MILMFLLLVFTFGEVQLEPLEIEDAEDAVVGEEYEYEYEDIDPNQEWFDPTRLIGAGLGSTKKMPFLVGLDVKNIGSVCTGSLITPNYVLSAYHCFVMPPTVDLCLKATAEQGEYKSNYSSKVRIDTMQCELQGDDIHLKLVNPLGIAFFGIGNVRNLTHHK